MAKSTVKNTLPSFMRARSREKLSCRYARLTAAHGNALVKTSALCAVLFLILITAIPVRADDIDSTQPMWMLLLGDQSLRPSTRPGGVTDNKTSDARSLTTGKPSETTTSGESPSSEKLPVVSAAHTDNGLGGDRPMLAEPRSSSILVDLSGEVSQSYVTAPFRSIVLKNISPLYTAPELPGEGIWRSQGLPTSPDGQPVMYRTSYRPSMDHPNAIAHMLLFDMKRLSMKLYIGSSEPGGSVTTATIEPESRSFLLAVTNALWKQKHSGEAGAVFRGNVVKPLSPGMATVVVYNDGSMDIMEWNEGIPVSLVRDARQLRHLIVKDGKVVDTIVKGGQTSDGEIGLGFLLSEEQPSPDQYWWGGYGGGQPNINYGADWFIATRSAFGIRKDGNLVFAAGYHISTKDLAKALVLAGCDRAIHGDANPHNVLGNLYYPESDGASAKKAKLSPEQRDTLNRYDRSYTSDFFGFFLKKDERNSSS
jgi:hypothetical protein